MDSATFHAEVYRIVNLIPPQKVISYGKSTLRRSPSTHTNLKRASKGTLQRLWASRATRVWLGKVRDHTGPSIAYTPEALILLDFRTQPSNVSMMAVLCPGKE